jgi:GTP-binding protein HflX
MAVTDNFETDFHEGDQPPGDPKRAMVFHPHHKLQAKHKPRDPQAMLDEAVGLARAIELEIAGALIVPIQHTRPSHLFGEGKVEELKTLIRSAEAGLVIMNCNLSPVQQRNLERAWQCKVIDRTALILEIFGARARTREGKLQVELAALNYQKSRLVRSWTHLERQRGGFGFLGGPGESQIEIDRRIIRDRIALIRKQLETVVRTRELHRKVRREVPFPVVALVGYTNAGKSTLFNRLTGAEVLAEDKLFATLDPTLRKVRLPSGQIIILSDTVGFVSDLPTDLVAAFRATLEEVLEADLLLHVRDISHTDTEAQRNDVLTVLSSLGISDSRLSEAVLEVHNKIDLMEHPPEAPTTPKGKDIRTVPVSALTGEGTEALLQLLDSYLSNRLFRHAEVVLPLNDSRAVAWLHQHGTVLEKQMDEESETFRLQVQMTPTNLGRFRREFQVEVQESLPL